MDHFETLYEDSETAQVRFFGFASERTRYDFGFVFTHRFYGKPLVICMQTGQSALLSSEDVNNPSYLQKIFRLKGLDEAMELSSFFKDHLPSMPLEEQQY